MNQVQPTEQRGRDKNYANVRVTASLTPVIFPIDIGNLTRTLKKRGYESTMQVPPVSIGLRMGGAGTLARKGDIAITADSERRFIGIDGTSPNDVLSSFEELTEVIKNDLWVDVHGKAAYYEAIIRMNVLGRGNPTEVVGRFFQDLGTVKSLETIIGEATSLFTIRLVAKGKLTGDQEWFEIRIEPDVARPDSTYMIEIVYRKSEYGPVRDFVSTIDQKIDEILDKME